MAAVFGANGAAARLAVGQISPLLLVSLRWLFVPALLPFVFARQDWRELGALLRGHPFLLAWMGLLGFSGFNALYYIAAYRSTAVNLTLLQSSIPAMVLIGAALVFGQKVRPLQFESVAGRGAWPTAEGWVLTLLIAVGPSFSGQLCYMRGVDLIGPARAGLFMNLVPIFGALTAVAVLHERVTLAHGVAVALGLAGITLAEWTGPRGSAAHAEAAGDAGLP